MPPAPPARARARRSPVAVGRGVAVLLLDLLAPPRCLACRSRGRAPWCPGCGSQVRVLAAGCARCGTPRGGAHRCWTPGAPISTTTVAYDYHGPLARGLATAKLAGAHAAWPALAAPLASRLAARPPDVDVVTWITTPAVRVRARGLDHAQRLAVLLGTRLGLRARQDPPLGEGRKAKQLQKIVDEVNALGPEIERSPTTSCGPRPTSSSARLADGRRSTTCRSRRSRSCARRPGGCCTSGPTTSRSSVARRPARRQHRRDEDR
jgi:predicted amidophosphoribosyltransferase